MVHPRSSAQIVQPATGRLGIDDVSPSVAEGRYPAKAVVGEVVPITATVWREGHDAVAATVVWQKAGETTAQQIRMAPHQTEPDLFVATVVADEPGLWTFWDYQAGAWQRNKALRIDHLLMSPQAADRITAVGIDKGFGVAWSARETGLAPEELMVIGDGDNDLSMFRVAGTAVAMGQAADHVKAQAHLVTDGFAEDGAATALMSIISM